MLLFIGIDDTDHPNGGCTTWSSHILAKFIEAEGAEIIERRLVRLWPFAPRRTRGNGAVCLVVDTDNPSSILEVVNIWFNSLLKDLKKFDRLSHARPGLVILKEQYSDHAYWEAVRHEVDHSTLEVHMRKCLLHLHHPEGKDGLIGALAAASWMPKESVTWEAIAWRNESRWGSPREVSPTCLDILEESHPETFMNRDPTRGHGMIAPRSPCPVLFGIRARSHQSALAAIEHILSSEGVESAEDYAIFKTNQCSDDHLLGPLKITTMTPPRVHRGGHVTVATMTEQGPLLIRCFKEGGNLNNAVLSLEPGDIAEVLGLLSPDGELHLERMRTITLVPRNLSRPLCKCGVRFRSSGRNSTLRCKECGSTSPRRWSAQTIGPSGWVEPSADQRRHLAKPVAWMGSID